MWLVNAYEMTSTCFMYMSKFAISISWRKISISWYVEGMSILSLWSCSWICTEYHLRCVIYILLYHKIHSIYSATDRCRYADQVKQVHFQSTWFWIDSHCIVLCRRLKKNLGFMSIFDGHGCKMNVTIIKTVFFVSNHLWIRLAMEKHYYFWK